MKNPFKQFRTDFLICFAFSSLTINIFELMKLKGTDIVDYVSIKFMYCWIVSIFVALGRIFADAIFYNGKQLFFWIKKNLQNEQQYISFFR